MKFFNEKKQLELYEQFNNKADNFKQYCIEVVKQAKKPNPDLIKQLNQIDDKNILLKKTNDFLMKGMGYGVIDIK